MATEDLIEIGNMLYERRGDGVLYPVRRVRPDTEARGAPAQDPSLLNVGGIGERLAFLNQTFNPVEGIGGSMRAASRMVAPDQSYWDRISALGEMASGVASIAAPVAAARAIGVPAASAMMEVLLGGSPTTQAARVAETAVDVAQGRPPLTFDEVERAMQEAQGIRAYQGSPHNFAAERLVRMPDGSTQYIVGQPDVLPDVPVGAEVLQDFPIGRMRMDKLGTGEGAQAYGRGIYAAEAEDVARAYRDTLSQNKRFTPYVTYKAEELLKDAGGDYEKAADAAKRLLTGNIDRQQSKEIGEVVKLLDDKKVSRGSMYEVNINADPADFLDWDAPLSEQPQVARRLGFSPMSQEEINSEAEAIMNAMPGGAWMNDPASKARIDELQNMLDRSVPEITGQEYYRGGSNDDVSGILSQMGYGDPEAQAQALSEAGIPGIKYLDAGSRSAGGGSRNYVVFDENLISIVRKYGIAGAAAMLGVSAADVEEAIAQGMPPSQWDQLVAGPQ